MSSDARLPRLAWIDTPAYTPLDTRTRVAMAVGYWLLRLLGLTWRVQVHGRDVLMARAATDARVVLSLWHGQMLPILWAHRQPTATMVSEHKDGEIIAQVLSRFGFGAIRGSSSRGGARALLEAVRVLKRQCDVAITPDGPRGPRHAVAAGVLAIAARSNSAIVPLVAHVERKWQLTSWDGFEIPKPFARVTVLYGTPLRVAPHVLRALAASGEQLGARMLAEAERAASLSRGVHADALAPCCLGEAIGDRRGATV